MSRQRAALCALGLLLLAGFWHTGQAEPVEPAPVELVLLSEPETASRRFDVQLRVIFHDPSLWHAEMYVSYHVDTVPERRLAEEAAQFDTGVILPLVLDADGTAQVDIPVDVSAWSGETLYVHYDILDDRNHRWLAYEPDILPAAPFTVVSDSPAPNALASLGTMVRENPVVTAVNVLFFGLFIVGCVVVRRRRRLNF